MAQLGETLHDPALEVQALGREVARQARGREPSQRPFALGELLLHAPALRCQRLDELVALGLLELLRRARRGLHGLAEGALPARKGLGNELPQALHSGVKFAHWRRRRRWARCLAPRRADLALFLEARLLRCSPARLGAHGLGSTGRARSRRCGGGCDAGGTNGTGGAGGPGGATCGCGADGLRGLALRRAKVALLREHRLLRGAPALLWARGLGGAGRAGGRNWTRSCNASGANGRCRAGGLLGSRDALLALRSGRLQLLRGGRLPRCAPARLRAIGLGGA
mmetsp:Transcript_22990/g.66628  ORF Transcript_22990/g.66628 Transcript_22990/m.66628 type:complete len:282 (-) Transcript_22990:83-928(-)